MENKLYSNLTVHITKYLGIALVAGSIVHAGTLSGSTLKYALLIGVGIALTLYGNILDHKIKNIKIKTSIILLTILLSFGTGMLSGGIQHYADNPSYASILLSVGFLITFLSFGYLGHEKQMTRKMLAKVFIISVAGYVLLMYFLAPIISHNRLEADHHSVKEESHS